MNETTQKVNRSGLMTAYNLARPLVKAGRIDGKRLNKALGIAQAKGESHIERYGTTLHSCSCPDSTIRRQTCKGQMALQLRELAQ